MGDIVYSASALKAFSGALVVLLFFIVLGVAGLAMALFKTKEKLIVRILTGGAGLLLCLVAVIIGLGALRSYTGGSEEIQALLNKKRVVTSNCDSASSKCTNYLLEMQSESTFYDVEVSKDAFDSVQEGQCYRLTYYPNNGLLGMGQNLDSYQSIGGVTQITTSACP